MNYTKLILFGVLTLTSGAVFFSTTVGEMHENILTELELEKNPQLRGPQSQMKSLEKLLKNITTSTKDRGFTPMQKKIFEAAFAEAKKFNGTKYAEDPYIYDVLQKYDRTAKNIKH